MNIYVVIPAYNEGTVIGKVVTKLKKAGYKNVLVVDDGSTDNCGKIAAKAGAKVLTHIINRGQGAALKTGNECALKNNANIIVHFDADGQMQVSDIKKMIQPLIYKKCDITIGSRFLGEAKNIDFGKKFTLKIARFVVFILYGLWLTDSQNGFRSLTAFAAKKIQITSDKMEHAGEILGEIKENKLKYEEIPVTIKYTKYSTNKGQHWTKSFELGTKMILRKFLKE